MRHFKNSFRYLPIFSLLIILFSGCNTKQEYAPDTLVNRIAANVNNPDSISFYKALISEQGNDSLRHQVMAYAADSSVNIQACVMVITMLPDEIANEVLTNPKKDLAQEVRRVYVMLNDNDDYNGFATQLTEQYDKLNDADKARFITMTGTPQSCAAAIEYGDSSLINEIRIIYSDSPGDLKLFEESLATNMNIK